MKKLLSFALVLAMVLGSVSMAFAGTTLLSDVAGLEQEEAINVLTGLGVVNGVGDGTFNPSGNVTRAQMAKMICAALNLPVASGNYPTTFTDVKSTDWFAPYVYYAQTLGVVKGKSDTIFDPNGDVTYDQAITMMIRSLGYTDESLPGAWPANYVNKAVGLGLLKDLQSGSNAANRADMAQLLYNGIQQPIGHINADGEWVANVGKDGKASGDTLLSRLNANVAKSGTKTEYKVVDMALIEDEDTLVDLSGLFGQVCSFYENEDGQIVAVADQLTTAVKAKYFEYGDADNKGSKDKAYAWIGDTKLTSTDLTEVLSNGGADATSKKPAYAYFENATDKTTTPAASTLKNGGTYTFAVTYDGNKIDKIYSASKWTAGSNTAMVDEDALDHLNDKKPSLLGVKFALNDDDEIDNSKFILSGVDKLEDIEEYNVVYVYEGNDSNSTNKIVRKIEVGQKVVSGKLEETDNDGNMFIDGTKYAMAEKADKLNAFADEDIKAAKNEATVLTFDTDKDTTAYLDYAGKVFAVKATTSSDYAVFLAFQGYDDNQKIDGSAAKIKVFTEDGEEVVYELGNSTNTDNAYKKVSDKCWGVY